MGFCKEEAITDRAREIVRIAVETGRVKILVSALMDEDAASACLPEGIDFDDTIVFLQRAHGLFEMDYALSQLGVIEESELRELGFDF